MTEALAIKRSVTKCIARGGLFITELEAATLVLSVLPNPWILPVLSPSIRQSDSLQTMARVLCHRRRRSLHHQAGLEAVGQGGNWRSRRYIHSGTCT